MRKGGHSDERLNAFCDALAEGAGVVEAGVTAGYKASVAHATFQKVRRKLGWQAS